MKLYNYKYRKMFTIGVVISLVISIVLSFLSNPFLDLGLIFLNIFLFLLAITSYKDEDENIKNCRYSSLLAVFVITFATFISFSIVSLLIDKIILDFHSILSLSILLLSFFHTIFKIKIAYSDVVDKVKSKPIVKLLCVLVLLAVIFLNIYLYFV